MKMKAFRKCFVGGGLVQIGGIFDAENPDDYVTKALPLGDDYVEPTLSERQSAAEAHADKMEAAAIATSSKAVIERTTKGKQKKAKPELPGGQAPTAKVTEVGSK